MYLFVELSFVLTLDFIPTPYDHFWAKLIDALFGYLSFPVLNLALPFLLEFETALLERYECTMDLSK